MVVGGRAHGGDGIARRHGIADYDAAVPSRAARLLPGVLPKAKVLAAMRDLCALPPLCLPTEQFDAAGINVRDGG